MSVRNDELESISDELETKTPQEILSWAVQKFGSKICMATAFGAEGCCLLAMLSEIPNDVHIFNLDTGYQFNETLELKKRFEKDYGLTIHFERSDESVEEMERRFGGAIYESDPDQCCYIRKIVPLRRVVSGYDAWISAIRRDQSASRSSAKIVEMDKKFNLIKINPLAAWTKKDVWNYLLKNGVPYNPLHDQGYPSIGCQPCTRPANEGEDERAGRWAGKAKTECGLHA
jgi:phosphoadenosine phosphosulfate reductase